MLKRFLIPGYGFSAIMLNEKRDSGKSDSYGERLCRRSELPIYGDKKPGAPHSETPEKEPNVLEKGISACRKELWNVRDKFRDVTGKAKESFEGVEKQTSVILDYLKEESNVAPRVGAIALSGLTGYIFGLRGGNFRRLTYGTIGSLGMASLCYPKEAAEYSKDFLTNSKRGVAIGYNFIFGVKPDEPIQFPEIPTSMSDLWTTVTGFGKKAQDMLPKAKPIESKQESVESKGQP